MREPQGVAEANLVICGGWPVRMMIWIGCAGMDRLKSTMVSGSNTSAMSLANSPSRSAATRSRALTEKVTPGCSPRYREISRGGK